MPQLTINKRIRFSADDCKLMAELKRNGINPSRFIRKAFREKAEKEPPKLTEKELDY